MTIDELAEQIKKAQEAGHGSEEVWMEGCDCIGKWDGSWIITKTTIIYPKERKVFLLNREYGS